MQVDSVTSLTGIEAEGDAIRYDFVVSSSVDRPRSAQIPCAAWSFRPCVQPRRRKTFLMPVSDEVRVHIRGKHQEP